MKRTINRIMIICMLIGFSISPSVLKSQSIQNVTPILLIANSNMHYSISSINWLNLIRLISSSTNLMQTEYVEKDSLNRNTDFSKNKISNKDIICPKMIRPYEKKIKRKSYRNMSVTIQTRI